MSKRESAMLAAVIAAAGATAGIAHAGVASASIVAAIGDEIAPGVAITSLNDPFTNGNGLVGFTGGVSGDNFVWYDTGVIWLNSSGLPDVLTGAEGTMGIGNSGEFIYSPSTNGNDSVWNHNGVLAQRGDASPDIPAQFITFASRPMMTPGGSSYFVSGLNPTQGSGTTINRTFMRADSSSNLSTVLHAGNTVIDGLTIATGSGIDFDYAISDNDAHHIHVLDMDTGSTANDFHVYLSGSLAHQEGTATGQGDNWANFDSVGVNNAGNYVFSGDTDGATGSDEFIAYNGSIALREGDLIDSVTLGTSVTQASLNNLNQVAYLWNIAGGGEGLFFGDGADLGLSSILLLQTGDGIDTTGDNIADFTVTDFNASAVIGPGLDFAEDGFIHVNVDLASIATGATTEAIIRVVIPSPSAAAVFALAGLAGLRRRR